MFLTRNMTPQPLMDCFAAHQSYKDSIKARRALKKKKGEKNMFFLQFSCLCETQIYSQTRKHPK